MYLFEASDPFRNQTKLQDVSQRLVYLLLVVLGSAQQVVFRGGGESGSNLAKIKRNVSLCLIKSASSPVS